MWQDKKEGALSVEENTFVSSHTIAFPETFPTAPYQSSGKLGQLASSTTSRRRRAGSSSTASTAGELTGILELLSGETGLAEAPSFAPLPEPLREPSPPPLPPGLSTGNTVCVVANSVHLFLQQLTSVQPAQAVSVDVPQMTKRWLYMNRVGFL